MKTIYYTNPAAQINDLVVPVVQTAPLEYGGAYEVSDEMADMLLKHRFWSEDPPDPFQEIAIVNTTDNEHEPPADEEDGS